MQKYTHLVVGWTFSVILAKLLYGFEVDIQSDLASFVDLSFISLGVQGAIFGIAPDFDHLFKGLIQHRCGLTHSVYTFTALAPIVAYLIRFNPVVAALAVFLHWLLDALNPSGVRTIGFTLDFFIKHGMDFKIANVRYDNHLANFAVCAFAFSLLYYALAS
ncbi:MAG: metal-dependent hydrolase [archaeon GB-1867-005]|nr:metal-dependent hydrolase [Candidatus Culexmicrobium cathedralense]